jgi:hypothetical protein
MKRSFGKLLLASLAAVVLAIFAMAPYADAAAARGGGGGGGGAARGGGGGGARTAGAGGGTHAAAGGGARQSAQVNNSKADARTNNVRSTSVNNVNVERNVNVDVEGHGGCCGGGWDNDYHPVATAAAVGSAVAVTSAIVGSMVRSVPPSCVPVNYGGMVYQQCGSTWYQPQGSQYVVVNPPY